MLTELETKLLGVMMMVIMTILLSFLMHPRSHKSHRLNRY